MAPNQNRKTFQVGGNPDLKLTNHTLLMKNKNLANVMKTASIIVLLEALR